jgi:hypothetical protein
VIAKANQALFLSKYILEKDSSIQNTSVSTEQSDSTKKNPNE